MLQLEKTVFDSLESAGVKDGDVLLAAVSGGADSTALLSALASLRSGFCLHVIHINHSLRGDESLSDAAAVEAYCEKLNVSCRVVTAAEGLIEKTARRLGIEAAARDFRHAALRQEAERLKARFIVIAHNRDDMLENTLLRILRGAGPAGLAAMPERNGPILRPLITLSRAEITGYLLKKNLSWREDSSNKDERYLRNRIRRRLIPVLDEYFPDWRQAVIALAETQALTAEFLSAEALRRINWEEASDGKLLCALSKFAAESQIIREEALFLAYDRVTEHTEQKNTAPAPRRSTIRKAAYAIGSIKFEARDGILSALQCKQPTLEECASILIEAPGVYQFGNLSIECVAGSGPAWRFVIREDFSKK
ncbi:MAG: tRNA lysidine(34) synthetase TilS [Spirochaetaceae bacterium]|jgi:tRNA(Ile)-lysidine synthase|nr:tRNA lysidine(34) synthetase TilS [Spirochaetaceae bacterium]